MLPIRNMEACLKSFSLPSVLTLVVFISACGGGSSGDTKVGTGRGDDGIRAPVSKLNDSPQIIEYHGDSTVWGWDAERGGAQVDTPAPSAFEAALPDYHEVRNRGENGTTACDLLNGDITKGYEQSWAEYMKISDATVVIINHGINDMSAYSVDRYSACLANLVDIARAEGKVAILETPNPAADGNQGAQQAMFVQAMKDVAEAKRVSLIDQYAHLRQDEFGGTDPYAICDDGVHPRREIYIEKGEYAAEQFKLFDQP